MNIPAIRGKIGIWRYYISAFNFRQITDYVKRIDDELHKSKTLGEMIQRSITDNYKSIRDYILNHEERFFNSLVLAVYDGDPQWIEVELDFSDEEFFNLGFLKLTGEEKIFPVDGQHRVEGIKAALENNPDLESEQIPVILISHSTSDEGMRRSRRLFSTLNRYAKPVTMDDIIALDEDDAGAIVTRFLLENFPLFAEKNVHHGKQKAIPDSNKIALTSIITLYQCNIELLKNFRGKQNLSNYLKRRPAEIQLNRFQEHCVGFWTDFQEELSCISEYVSLRDDRNPASSYRNGGGGNILFRPVGLLPVVIAAVSTKQRKRDISFKEYFGQLNNVNLELNKKPWIDVLWNPYEKKMIMGNQVLTKLIILYKTYPEVLSDRELRNLKEQYAAKIAFDSNNDEVLGEL